MSHADLSDRRILLAVTGASGAIYAERILNVLVNRVPRIAATSYMHGVGTKFFDGNESLA